ESQARWGHLWWADAGGGAGSLGVLSRFCFLGLPEPPRQVLLTALAWDWKDFAKEEFAALLTAYGEYFQAHQDASTAAGKLFGLLKLNHVSNGQIGLLAQVDVDDPDGRQAMADFLEAVDGRIGP